MQSALAAALRLASMLSSNQSPDTIQQAMAVLDSVNKKLYGMIDQTPSADSSKGEVRSTTTSKSLDSVRGYGDDDDDEQQDAQYGYGTAFELGRQQSATKRPSSPPRSGTSSQQYPASGPSKRFHFGL